jgi:hypothetical protein
MRRVGKNSFTEIYFAGCNPSFVETSDGCVMIDSPQRCSASRLSAFGRLAELVAPRGSPRTQMIHSRHLFHCNY